MSLFHLINWWSGQASVNNNSDDNVMVMCVSRFNSFESKADQVEKDTIFVGSSSGLLSIYQPSDVFYVTGHQSPTDVIMECQLNEPIIDIKCGKFAMSKSDKFSVAVLHPNRVVCYSIAFSDGIAEYGKQFKLIVAFEFNLSSFAFTLCVGSFGGVKSKEFFCLNHLANNELRFFEQDGIAIEGVLPGDRTLPSKILYLSRVDCFVVVSMPDDVLECYKYQDLITSTKVNPTAPVWTFCVGEFVLEMATHQTTNSESIILLLGENNLICLTDGGVIKFIKKLDYTAVTFHSFVVGYYFEPDARLMIAIASDMESLFVYECSSTNGPTNCKLIWSTQLPFVPVAISRANFEGMPGGLVLLSETGTINVSFFGTDPQIFKVPPLIEEVHLESVQEELKRLEGVIKEGTDFTDVSFINAATNRDLQISTTTKPELIACKPYMMKNLSSLKDIPKMVCVQVKLTPRIAFEQIQIAVNPPPPLAVTENSISFEKAEAEKELVSEFWIYSSKPQDPPSLSVPIIVSLINSQGVPRVVEKTVDLPPELILKQCPPQKEGQFKLTVKVKSTTKEIWNLFPEFATDTINQQAVGLQSVYSGDTITIVLAKNSSRYRIQSDSLSIMPIVTELLIQRIQKPVNPSHSSIATTTTEDISISQSYFTDHLMDTVGTHFSTRNELKRVDKEIEKKSRQMRLFQRKLALKLQQDPPHPSYNSAAKLLRLTHADLTELQGNLLKAVDRLRESQLILGNHLGLIKLIIHHSKMPLSVKDNLFAALINPVNDWIDMSWEEALAPSMELIAHVGPLEKNKTGSSREDIKSIAQLPFDMERFQKNLKYVLDKIECSGERGFVEMEGRESGEAEEETSDWLVDKADSPEEAAGNDEEELSVNDMQIC